MTGDEIREAFLRFFEEKEHKILPSSSLIPQDDPTLLLTTAGMVQIKPYFLGTAPPPSPRLASCQKCFRTTDIESVGDTKHLTCFEMLGNFSVGDYSKRETIQWAWEFVTQRLRLPLERLWMTIFLDDEESFKYWQEVGVPAKRILRFGEKDNFWGPAGDSGPCGPCSEIHYDFGEEFGCGKPDCGPNCDCPRFTEIWNLVFTQYNQDKEGKRILLSRPNIDTGMGLERTAAVMQGKTSVYETDLFAPIIGRVSELTGKSYGQEEATDRAMRIVAEHGRGITFLIADGVLPSNEGRGYVLRRVLRRAALFGRKLGLKEPFLAEVAKVVIVQMGHTYPELEKKRDFVLHEIDSEETKSIQTLDQGLTRLEEGIIPFLTDSAKVIEEVIRRINRAPEPSPADMVGLGRIEQLAAEAKKNAGELVVLLTNYLTSARQDLFEAISQRDFASVPAKIEGLRKAAQRLPGEVIFRLKDTHGLDTELAIEVATEHGLSVDLAGFEREMKHQQERARAAQRFTTSPGHIAEAWNAIGAPPTEFTGYETLQGWSPIVALFVDAQPVQTVSQGQDVEVVLLSTPFYGEMGGQVGDQGEISHGKDSPDRIQVTDVVRDHAGHMVHQGVISAGKFIINDAVFVEVDKPRRLDIERNHTTTHLLQAALRAALGEHVHQAGSLVAPERLRFDFTHLSPVTKEQLTQIQHIVNEKIRQNLPVVSKTMAYAEAVSKGAIALFGEKYGGIVRVVEIGDPPISMELCGGTHVRSTGEIGLFCIVSETGIGSGMRRIEAVTGREAESFVEQRFSALEAAAQRLQASPQQVPEKVSDLFTELDRECKRALALEQELAKRIADSLLPGVELINGINILSARISPMRLEVLRALGDQLKERLGSGIFILGTIHKDKPHFVAMVTPDLTARGFHAGEIVREVAKVTGGGGGGKSELGQGSGKDKSKLDEALMLAKGLVRDWKE